MPDQDTRSMRTLSFALWALIVTAATALVWLGFHSDSEPEARTEPAAAERPSK